MDVRSIVLRSSIVHVPGQCVFSLVRFIFCFVGGVTFSKYFVPLPFPPCMESTLYIFLPDGVFLPCDHGLDSDISLCENSKQIKV